MSMQVPCTESGCGCVDVVPEDHRAASDADPCLCGHAIGAHHAPCPACGAQLQGLDVACRRCGALTTDSIERGSIEVRNGFAFASMFVGFAPILAPVAIGLGIVALRQLGRNPMQVGRGYAVAGITMGSMWLLLVVGGLVFDGA